jgi:hypothetical protein
MFGSPCLTDGFIIICHWLPLGYCQPGDDNPYDAGQAASLLFTVLILLCSGHQSITALNVNAKLAPLASDAALKLSVDPAMFPPCGSLSSAPVASSSSTMVADPQLAPDRSEPG